MRLSFDEGLTLAEAGRELDIEESTAKAHRQRAIKKLRHQLDDT